MLQKTLVTVYTFLIFIAVFLFWLSTKELLPAERSLKSDSTILAASNGRKIEHVIIHGKNLGDIGIIINYPDPLPAEKLPVLFVLGGLANGEKNLQYITHPGKNVIVGYDWPMPIPLPKGVDMILHTPALYQNIMLVPGQGASAIRWVAEQPWADKNRISLLGFSLGAIATPSIEHLTEENGIHVGWTILAYGGAPLGYLVLSNTHLKPALLRYILSPLASLIFKPIEPTRHLPYLSSNFLIIEGINDNLIPAKARQTLRDAVPDPKQVIDFNSSHMGVGPDKLALLKQIIEASTNWLITSGAANN